MPGIPKIHPQNNINKFKYEDLNTQGLSKRRSQEDLFLNKLFESNSKPVTMQSTRYMRISTSVMSLKGSSRRQRILNKNKILASSVTKDALKNLPKFRKRF